MNGIFSMNRELTNSITSDDWTFNGASTRDLTHCYHDYPAKMIPQVAGRLLDTFGTDAKTLFDPYCGTGTSLVEGMIRGIDVIGTDLNPLARLIARAKTATAKLALVDAELNKFKRFISRPSKSESAQLPILPGVLNPEFWFKPEVTTKITLVSKFITKIEDEPVRLFFQVAFSETVRESSNTRNREFKLYRYTSDQLRKFSPDVFGMMTTKLARNRAGLAKFMSIMQTIEPLPIAQVHEFNTVKGIPYNIVSPASIDIVVTSPPYGDSHTTVAYGQYSRLSAAWLGLPDPHKVDTELMGGKIGKAIPTFPSDTLNDAISQIRLADPKRALEVSSFYSDLYNSISNVCTVLKPGGYTCYVVGNRKVKGVVLPTSQVIRDFFEHFGFEYITTFHRSIPNKRMPLRNSPTNVIGLLDSTMTQEHLVVMRRPIS